MVAKATDNLAANKQECGCLVAGFMTQPTWRRRRTSSRERGEGGGGEGESLKRKCKLIRGSGINQRHSCYLFNGSESSDVAQSFVE